MDATHPANKHLSPILKIKVTELVTDLNQQAIQNYTSMFSNSVIGYSLYSVFKSS
jgi:hypothetical protein